MFFYKPNFHFCDPFSPGLSLNYGIIIVVCVGSFGVTIGSGEGTNCAITLILIITIFRIIVIVTFGQGIVIGFVFANDVVVVDDAGTIILEVIIIVPINIIFVV